MKLLNYISAQKFKIKPLAITPFIVSWILVLAITPLLLMALFSYTQFKAFALEEHANDLKKISLAKAANIEAWFESKIKEVEVQSRADSTVKLFESLLQGRFENNSTIKAYVKSDDWKSRVEALEHDLIVYSQAYDDIDEVALIDHQGNILYTTQKQTNLGNNIFRTSKNIKKFEITFNQALASPVAMFSGMDRYATWHKKILSFISIPVKHNSTGELLGLMTVRLKLKDILNQHQSTEHHAFKKEGEKSGKFNRLENEHKFNNQILHYLVAQDGTLRSPIDGDWDQVLNRQVDNLAFRSWQKGKNLAEHTSDLAFGVAEYVGVNGRKVIGTYENIELGGNVQWAFVSEMDLGQVLMPVKDEIGKVTLFAFIVGVMAILLGLRVAKKISKPIEEVANFSIAIADGLADRCEASSNFNEILQLEESLNYLIKMKGKNEQNIRNSKVELETAIKELEHQKFILDQHSIVAITDVKGAITYVNNLFVKISGYSSKELLGSNHRIINSDFHSKEFFRQMYLTISSGGVWKGEVCNKNKSGDFYWVDTTIVPLMGENSKPISYIAIRTDITDRKQAEINTAQNLLDLEESRKELNMLINSIDGIFWMTDMLTGKRLYVSPQVEKIMGFTPEQWNNRPDEADLEVNLEGKQDVALGLMSLTAKNPSMDVVHQELNIKGEPVWLRSIMTAEIEKGVLKRLWGASFDISEGKILAEQNKNIEQQLGQAQKLEAVGQLAAGIAHEINTPTQFITDNVNFIKDSQADFQKIIQAYEKLFNSAESEGFCLDFVQHIKSVIEEVDYDYLKEEVPTAIDQSLEGLSRVANIVGAMKEFSHPGSTEKQSVDINRGIRNTAIVASNEWKYNADIEYKLSENMPFVSCLPGELNQVVLNIIVNASHAIAEKEGDSGEKGKITISTKLNESYVEIAISDTGNGMPESVKEKIFDPFFTTKGVGKGTGQGLSIAYSVIVDKHQGSIVVDSVVGEGTTFVIRIPIANDSEKEAAA